MAGCFEQRDESSGFVKCGETGSYIPSVSLPMRHTQCDLLQGSPSYRHDQSNHDCSKTLKSFLLGVHGKKASHFMLHRIG